MQTNVSDSKNPRVYDFVDFREYLRAYYNFKKGTSREFSLGTFARKAQLNTRNYLKRVIDGERPLTPDNLPKFCMALDLHGKEALYFESLVNYNQAKESLIKKYYFEQMKAAADGTSSSAFEITQAHYDIFKEWHIIPVLELFNFKNLDQDPKAISKLLRNKITAQEARNALHLLEKVGLISKNAKGQYIRTAVALSYSKDILNIAVQEFHKKTLAQVEQSIDHDTLDKRYLRSLTIAVDKKQIPELKKQIDQMLKKINAQCSKNNLEDGAIVQLNCQFLDLT